MLVINCRKDQPELGSTRGMLLEVIRHSGLMFGDFEDGIQFIDFFCYLFVLGLLIDLYETAGDRSGFLGDIIEMVG